MGESAGEVDHTACVVDTECIYDEDGETYTCTACDEGTTRAFDSESGCSASSIISFSVLLVALLATLLFWDSS